MSGNINVKKVNVPQTQENGNKVIDEANYQISIQRKNNNAIIGKGGDPLIKSINATEYELTMLLRETAEIQDYVQKETCNQVAIKCLDDENLKEVYFKMKDGFGDYGPMVLMGYKTPQGVEIPRLKLLDNNGEVIEVLSGPMAIDELNKRALAYKSENTYETLDIPQETSEEIQDYSGNPEDYT